MGTEAAQANTPTHGYAETREAAMAVFAKAVFAKAVFAKAVFAKAVFAKTWRRG
jgi:hypothetical protein